MPTAAAIWLLSGTEPEVIKRVNGDTIFQFPTSVQAQFDRFVEKKDRIDEMVVKARVS